MPVGKVALLAASLPTEAKLDGTLEGELDRVWDGACAAWPEVRLDFAAIAPLLAREIQRARDTSPAEVIRALHVGDLYLACACAEGDAAALRAIDAHCSAAIRDVVRRLRLAPDLCEETVQVTRELLFVKRGEAPPKVARYSGRGDLRSWTMVVAAREAVRLSRAQAREQPVDAAALLDVATSSSADVEVEYMKRTYRAEFEQALGDALAQLPARDRTVLKYRYVDGLNGRRIASIYKVHPATVTRWLDAARLALASLCRSLLESRLGLGERDIESLERLVRSQLDLSLSRHLAGTSRDRA